MNFEKTELRKADRAVGVNCYIFSNIFLNWRAEDLVVNNKDNNRVFMSRNYRSDS